MGRDYIQGQPTIHSCLLLYEARVILGLILSHSATVLKLPVGARHFARHPGGVKLNKTLSLPPWEFYSPFRVIRQPHEELSFLLACGHSLERAVQREERPAAFLLGACLRPHSKGVASLKARSGSHLGLLLQVSNQPSSVWQPPQPLGMQLQSQGSCKAGPWGS